jgi:hypothetical protein
MDVSRSEAQRAETNVIARSVDRATTIESESASHRREIKKGANGFIKSIGAFFIFQTHWPN